MSLTLKADHYDVSWQSLHNELRAQVILKEMISFEEDLTRKKLQEESKIVNLRFHKLIIFRCIKSIIRNKKWKQDIQLAKWWI